MSRNVEPWLVEESVEPKEARVRVRVRYGDRRIG
jgi:hypothetical protein